MNWVIVFLGFTILIVLHEAGHFFAAKWVGMRVEKFFLFFPPKVVSIKRGETEYGIGAIPAGGYVKITGMNPDEELPPEIAARGYYHQPVWKRIFVIGAGPAVNIFLAFAILFFLALAGSKATTTVGEITPGFPAGAVLQTGDKIVGVDGNTYPNLDDPQRITKFGEDVAAHKCPGKLTDGCRAAEPVTLQIQRNGKDQAITVTPRYDAAAQRMRVGFAYGTVPTDLSVPQAADRSVDFMWLVSSKTVSTFSRIFQEEERKQLSGVVGVSDVANQTIDIGWYESLTLLAVVSLSLGLINLFPFLPLDGGHIFWSIVEKVRGRPVSFRTMERAGVVGFVLVIAIAMIGLTNDIGRLTGEGFNVR